MIAESVFGALPDGREVMRYRITNHFGEYIELLNFGACIYSIFVRDQDGKLGDVVLGPRNLAALRGRSMSGVTVGRCANRIAYGRFQLQGRLVQLECNSGEHYLHGASGGYGRKLFRAVMDEKANGVCFTYTDNGEGGFGNRVEVEVRISFNDAHQVTIEYQITPEEDTLLCPTNHAYFNLDGITDIRQQVLCIHANQYAVKGDLGMPQGEISDVEGTPLDFRKYRRIGEALEKDKASFYKRAVPEMDDVFLLDRCKNRKFGLAAELFSRKSGRKMEVYTDMPAMIAYTRCVQEQVVGKREELYEGYCSIALETQYVPNAVNCDVFDVPYFGAGQQLKTKTVYAFGIYTEGMKEKSTETTAAI